MQRSIESLTGYTISAADGEIGKVTEFYFDDKTWTISYFIVETGNWLFGRKVLLSPVALQKPDWNAETFPTNLTMEQVKNSPDIDTEKPVSRQHETHLHGYYGWPYYPGSGFYGAGIGMIGMASPNIPFEDRIAEEVDSENNDSENPHLRSTSAVKGYKIHAIDGEIGEIEDYIVDEDTWTIRFLIVETGSWYAGEKVLLSPQWIKSVEWSQSTVVVDLPVESIKNSPEYDSSQPVNEAYENNLYDYYGKQIND